MINLIYGSNGSGKTQKLIDHANNELDNTDGLIVYLDRSNNHRLAVSKQIRFINTSEFGVADAGMLYGMLCGLIAGNYDINRIYIDNITKMIGTSESGAILAILSRIKQLCMMNDMQCYVVLNAEDITEEQLAEYTILK
ncbi:MAG: hypothetical protein J5822_01460 [Eubacteriaceae bacterium]|nr:hypothetical protein [Eubacteriaceae bacterium]